MKGRDNHITQLFKKYFGGDASRLEMRQLKQDAEDNPYLSDAMEGVDKLSMVARETIISDLQTKLAKRTGKKENRIAPMQWLKLAAGIAILLTAGFFIWRPANTDNLAKSILLEEQVATQSESKETLKPWQKIEQESIQLETEANPFDIAGGQSEDPNKATIGEAKVASSSTHQGQIAENSNISNKVSQTKWAEKELTTKVESARDEAKDYSIDGVAVQGDLIPESNVIVASDTELKTRAEASPKSQANNLNEMASTSAGAASRSKVSKKTTASRRIQGNITDENGEALIGVSVAEKGTRNGTITDIDGNYSFSISEKSDAVVISYTGFETKEVPIGNQDEVNISLDQGPELSEVVVTGLGYKDANDLSQNSNPDFPVGGNSAFKKYIQENLVMPEAAQQNNIKGKVILLFDIDSAGRPIDIQVKKSLGYGCDEEAIRLLQEGPDWEQGDQDGKTKLVVKFK